MQSAANVGLSVEMELNITLCLKLLWITAQVRISSTRYFSATLLSFEYENRTYLLLIWANGKFAKLTVWTNPKINLHLPIIWVIRRMLKGHPRNLKRRPSHDNKLSCVSYWGIKWKTTSIFNLKNRQTCAFLAWLLLIAIKYKLATDDELTKTQILSFNARVFVLNEEIVFPLFGF